MSFPESNGVHESMQNLGSAMAAAADGTLTYNPMMPPILSSPSPTASYQVSGGGAAAVDQSAYTAVPAMNLNPNSIEPAKRKRGRPRKYAPDENPQLSASRGGGFSSPNSPSRVGKKTRGRPPGSRKQKLADLGSAGPGVGFRPYVITIKEGEDVLAKLMSFSQSTSQAVCILSANGSISNVTLQQPATSGGTVTYQGQFEILSLSGSFLLSESGGQRSRTGGLSVLLAAPDGHVLGGGVAGLLTAAASVQVIAGSFRMEGQKQFKMEHSDVFGTPAAIPVFAASAVKSPSSLGTVSESSGGYMSPHNQFVETSTHSPPGVSNFPWMS